MDTKKQSYLSLDERFTIEAELSSFKSFKYIADILGRDASAISREVRRNYTLTQRNNNLYDCSTFLHCRLRNLCGDMECRYFCRFCKKVACKDYCNSYVLKLCERLKKPPYVCNSCTVPRCNQTHHFYRATEAQYLAEQRISTARSGINMSQKELSELDQLVTPLIRNGQPISHIFYNNRKKIHCSRKTLYNYIDSGFLSVKNIDLRRKVSYKPRKKPRKPVYPSRNRVNRTYNDFQLYLAEHPDTSVVQMDTLHGPKEKGVCLLTIFFTNCSFMLIFRLSACTQKQVLRVFDFMYDSLGHKLFCETFPVILTDNGSEFKSAESIETGADGLQRTHIFYCDPMASWQKGAIEKNHEYIRYVIPKGAPLEPYSEENIKKLENHINNTARPALHGMTPYKLASLLIDERVLSLLNVEYIDPNNVCLTDNLFK